MKSVSYNMTIRTRDAIREDNVGKMEAQRLSSKKLGHLQKWVNKTDQSEQSGGLKGSSSVSSTEAYVGDSGNSCVHT